ncbi:MAG: hypothetical protein WC444_02350 [Candidatus Paceibacterota bacterium]
MTHAITTEEARRIFGTGFFGDTASLFFIDRSITIPDRVPLSERDAKHLAFLGFDLFFVPEQDDDKEMFTPFFLMRWWENSGHKALLLYEYKDIYKWYTKNKESFFYKESLRSGWFCIKRYPLVGTSFSVYKKQTEALLNYLDHEQNEMDVSFFKNDVPDESLQTLQALPEDASLALFTVNQNYRTSFTEELFRAIVFSYANIKLPLEDFYVWTNTVYEGKEIVRIGAFDEQGADVTKRDIFDGNSKTELTPVIHVGFA